VARLLCERCRRDGQCKRSKRPSFHGSTPLTLQPGGETQQCSISSVARSHAPCAIVALCFVKAVSTSRNRTDLVRTGRAIAPFPFIERDPPCLAASTHDFRRILDVPQRYGAV